MNELMRRRRALMAAGGGEATIHGTWEDLFRAIDAGTYATEYSLGEILPLDLGTEGSVGAQIIAFDTDDKADGIGKAPVTIISNYVLNTTHRWNPTLAGDAGARTVGTGTIGCYRSSEIRSYIVETITPMVPQLVSNRIVSAIKYSRGFADDETSIGADATSEFVWLPSYREIGYGTDAFKETQGVEYTAFFPRYSAGNARRVKTTVGGSANVNYLLRTGTQTNKMCGVYSGGTNLEQAVSNKFYLPIGFCVG